MESKYQSIIKQLVKSGIRITCQRKTIIRALLEANRHIRADELYDMVKAESIGVATVYRTIELLKEFDIIKIIAIGNDRYVELKKFSKNYTHINFKCIICSRIYDYSDRNITRKVLEMMRYLEDEYTAETHDLTILINGICSLCRR